MKVVTLRHLHPGAIGDIILSHNAFTSLANSDLEVYIDYRKYNFLLTLMGYNFKFGRSFSEVKVNYLFKKGIHASINHANNILDVVEFLTRTKLVRNFTIMPPQIPIISTSNIIAVSNKCSTFKNLKQLPEKSWKKLLQKLNDNNITFIDLNEINNLELAIKILSFCKYYLGIDSFFMHMSACYRIPRTIFWNSQCCCSPVEYGYIEGQRNVYFDNFDKYLESKEFIETVDSIDWKVHSLT